MASHAMFAEIAALSGDPARANMLYALMDGTRAIHITLKGVRIFPMSAMGQKQPRHFAAGAADVPPKADTPLARHRGR
jgi:hypothetical protein